MTEDWTVIAKGSNCDRPKGRLSSSGFLTKLVTNSETPERLIPTIENKASKIMDLESPKMPTAIAQIVKIEPVPIESLMSFLSWIRLTRGFIGNLLVLNAAKWRNRSVQTSELHKMNEWKFLKNANFKFYGTAGGGIMFRNVGDENLTVVRLAMKISF